MHILRLNSPAVQPIPVADGREIQPDIDYLVPDALAGSLLQTRWRTTIDGAMWNASRFMRVTSIEDHQDGPWTQLFDPGDYNDKDIWILRNGGYGDLLMLTPVFRALIRKWPTVTLHVMCLERYTQAIERWVGVQTHVIPVPLTEIGNSPVISLEEHIEGDPGSEKVHASQHFANRFGIDLEGDYRPSYYLDPKSLEEVITAYPRSHKKRVGIQITAAYLYRSYPNPLMKIVVQELLRLGYEVMLFGTPGQLQLKDQTEGVMNTTDRNYSFRQSAAALSTCDVCLAPDSAFTHLSEALGVPCIGLYGPIDGRLRITGETRAMQGQAPCAPCFYHAGHALDLPAGMPCQKANCCIALADIKPEEIVAQLTNLLTGGIITP